MIYVMRAKAMYGTGAGEGTDTAHDLVPRPPGGCGGRNVRVLSEEVAGDAVGVEVARGFT